MRCRVGSAYFADDQVLNWVQPLPTSAIAFETRVGWAVLTLPMISF
ncbi:hypothetical protein [Moorena producens]